MPIDPTNVPSLPGTQGQQAAFDKYRGEAAALPAEKVKIRGDVVLARENIWRGYAAVTAPGAGLDKAWPKPRLDALARLPDLTIAAVFASVRAGQLDVTENVIRPKVAVAYDEREKFLAVLEMAAKFGLVPADRVAKIRAGTGPIDAAQDLVSSGALYREFAAVLAGKTPVTPEVLTQAETLGNELVTALQPSAARAKANAEAKAAADLANRFWTLVAVAHVELRKAGYEIWGEAQDAHVPALQSRDAAGKKRVTG